MASLVLLLGQPGADTSIFLMYSEIWCVLSIAYVWAPGLEDMKPKEGAGGGWEHLKGKEKALVAGRGGGGRRPVSPKDAVQARLERSPVLSVVLRLFPETKFLLEQNRIAAQ